MHEKWLRIQTQIALITTHRGTRSFMFITLIFCDILSRLHFYALLGMSSSI